jgi:prepilin-type processing-associated H-X9-DG protein
MRVGAFRKGSAFTVIELLMVILVIGILAALLTSGLNGAKRRADSTTCKNHLRQMGQALQMYVPDNGSKYPHLWNKWDSSLAPEVGLRSSGYWWARLQAYYPINWTNGYYHCPGYKGLISPEVENHAAYGSYGYNGDGVAIPGSGYIDPAQGINIRFTKKFGFGHAWQDSPSLSEGLIVCPAEMVSIGESRWLGEKANGLRGAPSEFVCGLLKTSREYKGNVFAFNPARHGSVYNQVFCDGHVTSMNPWVFFNPTNSARMWNYDHQEHQELWIPD